MDYLKQLKSQLETIASNWNGDESGIAEERSFAAVEGISAVNTLLLILEELNIK
jgi:hypothetical protein